MKRPKATDYFEEDSLDVDFASYQLVLNEYIDQLEAEVKELKMCLQYLVDTKEYKEANGKDVTYIAMRKTAWNNANKILKKG